MIVFQAEDYQIDLSLYSIDLNEESNLFVDNMIKSYSYPFSMPITDALAKALGFPTTDNITSVNSNIKGILTIDDTYYEANLVMGEIVDDQIEVTLYYGEENLPVYETKLSDLPWPLQIVQSSQDLADDYLGKSWPDVSHNFPKIFRPKIKQENDYEAFELFVNNYDGNDFVQNVEIEVDNEPVYNNKNVLSPCVYMLEVLSFIYKQAGKKIRGSVVDDQRLKNLIYIPENYIEKFKGSLFQEFQLNTPDSTDVVTIDNLGGINAGIFVERINLGVYERSFSPDNLGTYNIKFNLNFDSLIASYFSMRVYQQNPISLEETTIFSSRSRFNRVNLNEELEIEITSLNQFHPIFIELYLPYRSDSIETYNSFEYSYKSGRLNELIGSYNLGQFMPDLTAGEYVNLIKNWLNLEIAFNEEYVYIDFVEDVIEELPYASHQNLEVRKPKKIFNNQRTFKITYADGSVAMADSSGQIYSDIDKEKKDIITIDTGVQMAIVERNFDNSTAVYPSVDAVTFTLYDGLSSSNNITKNTIDGFTGKADNIYQLFWSKWFAIRTNNITFTDKFMAHQSELIAIRSKIFKYNHVMIPMKIRKKRKLQEFWEVEVVAETI